MGSRAPSSSARRRCGRRIALGAALEGPAQGRSAGGLDRPLPVRLPRPEGAGRGDFRKVPNGLPGVEDRVDLMHDGGVVADGCRQALGRGDLHRPASCSACSRARAPSPSAPMRTSWSTTRIAVTRSPPRHITWTSTTPATRAATFRAGRRRPHRGAVVVRNGEFTGRQGRRPVPETGDGGLRPPGLIANRSPTPMTLAGWPRPDGP